nr:hypothetical protein [candidate division Zixibacteria bacterium]
MKRYWAVVLCLIVAGLLMNACSDDSPSSSGNNDPSPSVYTILATDSVGVTITVSDGERIQITTTDSVNSNPGGVVLDCDLWTDADGIATCQYVTTEPSCRNLPFMALIGYMGEDYFLIGIDFDSTFATGDDLQLLINDWVFDDNQGQFVVSLTRR